MSMIVFRCTAKVRKVLGLSDRDLYQGEGADMNQWFVDVAALARRRCLLFTHKPTRYSFWVARARKADREVFGDLFGQHLLRTLANDGFDQRAFERMFREEFRFAKTDDRSVLGSMNEHILNTRWYVQNPDRWPDIAAVNAQLNRTPMGGMAGPGQLEFPVEVLQTIIQPAAFA